MSSPGVGSPSAGRRPGLGPVLLTVFLDLLGFGLIIPLLPFFVESHGASPLQVTLLMASYSGAQFLGAPVWGALSDRVGRRPVLLVSTAATAVCLAAFALAPSLPWLFVARILNGLAAANVSTAQAYVADVTSGEDRARGMGLVGALFGLGFSVGPMLGGLLSVWGLATPILVAAGLSALNAGWIALRLPESHPPGTDQDGGQGRTRRTLDLRVIGDVLAHPAVGLAIGLVFVTGAAFALLESTFALVAEHVWARDAQTVGLLFGVVGAVGVVVQGGLIGPLSRRFGEGPLVRAGLAFTGMGMLILASAPWGWPVFAGCAVVSVGTSLTNPSLNSLISRATSADEQGRVLGTAQSLGALARTVAPGLGGWLFTAWQPTAALWVGGIATLASLAIAGPAARRAGSGPRVA